METRIHVRLPDTGDRSYPVVIGPSWRSAERHITRTGRFDRIFLVSDTTVMRLYGRAFARRLSAAVRDVRMVSFPPGERSKTRAGKERLEDRLLRTGITRSSLLVALGGGVTGDLAGFTASTLLRGIPYVHLPTTLLSQVDSSVGGKVAVNHPLGKNLIGAFCQPEAVFVNTSVLRTLPPKEFVSGMAEVIKYAMILDGALFRFLRKHQRSITRRDPVVMRSLVARCCRLKAAVVAGDERDMDYRRILNFGHTIGHAFEKAAGYRMPHGIAVSAGMVAEAGIACSLGLMSRGELEALTTLLTLFGLPCHPPRPLRRAAVLSALGHDKKKSGGTISYSLPAGIGMGVTGIPVPDSVLKSVLRP